LPRTLELPVTALTSLIRRENLGLPHTVLAGGDRYVSPRFETEAERDLKAELAQAGVDDDFRDTLALIQYARIEYYGWITAAATATAVLVAASGRAAVVLTRTGDRVAIGRADPDRLAGELVERLPDVPPGRGESITVLAREYAQKAGGYLTRPESARAQDARRLDALLRATRTGGAQLYVAGRDHAGTRHRCQECLTVLDIAQYGRWAVYPTSGRGERAVNAVPATPQWLATKLAETHREIRGLRPR
jgi:hypothetical protein